MKNLFLPIILIITLAAIIGGSFALYAITRDDVALPVETVAPTAPVVEDSTVMTSVTIAEEADGEDEITDEVSESVSTYKAPTPAPVVKTSVNCGSNLSCIGTAVEDDRPATYKGDTSLEIFPGIITSASQSMEYFPTNKTGSYEFIVTTHSIKAVLKDGWFEDLMADGLISPKMFEYEVPTEEELATLTEDERALYELYMSMPREDLLKLQAENYIHTMFASTPKTTLSCIATDRDVLIDVINDWGTGNFSTHDLWFAECDADFKY